MAEEPAPGLSFPTDPRDFHTDERISFSKLDNKHIGVLDDGTEFEWDAQLKRWIPTLDEELLAQQQSAYAGGATSDDSSSNNQTNKRKNGASSDRPSKKQKAPPQPRQNTAIYVTGLPLDVTVDEVAEAFSRKCGVIAEEIDSGRPRIKLYNDEQGSFKGDALVVFFKPQSVDMAIMLLDDTDFRYTASGLASGRMRVQAADSSYKKTTYEKENGDKAGGGGDERNKPSNGENTAITGGGGAGAPKPDRARAQDKQKIIKRTQKLDAKLADWDDDDPYGGQLETAAKRDRMVILRHMFTLQELNEDPAAMLDIKDDIREECEKLGPVTNVVLYDLEEDGVASVKFKTPEAAEACIAMMDGRAFDGRTVRAAMAVGKQRFRRSDKSQDDAELDEGED
ncbi:Uu.00g046100.m01.CDS01 [Anthostomella pinea]|uniref:Uu.00g046100.m01.CDS01 n=1 Tax=Anthostomella pinea TaxID=933095 RepID=A0AAI8VBT5_9PEZI|nr:Uu.00g046100.m01.CDS01 [Anthostomella pinea]